MGNSINEDKKLNSAKLWTLSFIFLMISNALLFMVFEMMLPTLPLFVTTLGGDATQIGIVTGIFMVSAIIVRLFTGVLARKINKKYLLFIGAIICAVSTGAYYLSPNVETLLVIRILHGAGFGLATTYFATIVAEIIPKERRGEGIGYFGVGETVAISVGPMMGILLLDLYGYQRLFLGGMSILLLATMSVLVIKKGSAQRSEENIQVKLIEKRVLFPSFLTLILGIAASGIMSYLSLYAIEKGFSGVGWFFFIVAFASFVIRFFSGNLFDKYGPSIILIPGSILGFLGFVVLYFAESSMSFFMAAILYGLGFGSIFPAIQTWCLNLVEEHEHEMAMASFFNFFDIGIGGGALLLGIIATGYSYQAIFLIAMVCYIAFFILYTCFITMKRNTLIFEKEKDEEF